MMKKIRLIHWNNEEAAQKAKLIHLAGFSITHKTSTGAEAMRNLLINPPAVFVIDLSRLPAQGRDLGMILRKSRTTRFTPIIYVGGNPEKVKTVKKALPDAVYSEWDNINQSIKVALKHVPENPFVPGSLFDVYAGKPLVQKLGIKSKMNIGLLQAPAGFEQTLGPLPEGSTISKTAVEPCALILWFIRSRRELESKIIKLASRDDYNSIWIIWPKKSASIKTDLTQQTVRQIGLASGLVDYKICAVDQTWSGLLFTRRKK